ncbi:Methyltransf_25 domain-containing protein [Azospirillaceae bacterium]
MEHIYNPSIFHVSSYEEAREIILTSATDASTDERWQIETPFLVERILNHLQPNENTLIVDYGCGIGRLAKELIARSGCWVIGVDISPSMRILSQSYVVSDRFMICSPISFQSMIERGLKIDHAYAVWVLQHLPIPELDTRLIKHSLRNNGKFYVVNAHTRYVPADLGWIDDGKSIQQILEQHFQTLDEDRFPEGKIFNWVHTHAFLKLYQKKDGNTL